MPASIACKYWIETLGPIVAAVAIAYLVLQLTLNAYVNRLGQRGFDMDRLPDPAWTPLTHLRMWWYVYATPAREIPTRALYALVLGLRLTTLPAFIGVVAMFILSIKGAHDPAACTEWLP